MTGSTLSDAAQAALDALESLQGGCTDSNDGTVEAITVWCPEVIAALRSALAAQAAPAQARQPLTDERIAELVLSTVYEGNVSTPHRDAWTAEIGIPFARAIESAGDIAIPCGVKTV